MRNLKINGRSSNWPISRLISTIIQNVLNNSNIGLHSTSELHSYSHAAQSANSSIIHPDHTTVSCTMNFDSTDELTTAAMVLHFIALFLAAVSQVDATSCADQLQICATATEQYEHQMEHIKRIAFRKCFPQSPCTSERIAFDDCFHSSLNAVRAHRMQAPHHSDNFMDTAERYRDAVDDCFLDDDLPASFPDLSAFVVDEDAVYARIVYGMEFADRLWGLPQVAVSTSLLDPKSVCLVRETVGRIFGNGISRTIDSADPQLNNLNTSCIVDDTQVQCYQRFLENDDQFQFLIITKDRALRACIQSVRLQTQCRTGDSSRLRVCLCSVREEFENRMQSSILQCSKNLNLSSIHDYRIYIDKSKQFTKYYPSDTATEIQPDVLLQGVQFDGTEMPQNSIPSNIVLDPKPSRPYFEIVQGTNLNGQCLCACEPPTTLRNNQPRNLPLADHRSQPKSSQQTFLSTAQARPPQWMSTNGARPNWKPWYRAESDYQLSPQKRDLFHQYYERH